MSLSGPDPFNSCCDPVHHSLHHEFPSQPCPAARSAARAKAEQEYARHRALLDSQPRAVDADFEEAAKELKNLQRRKKPKK